MADWSLLPGIAVVEVLSYLPLTDKLHSSSACRSWRSCLFYPSLWHNIHYCFTRKGRKRARLLTERCGTFVRDCTIAFDSGSVADLRGVMQLLQQLCRNPFLERLALRPSSCRIMWSDVNPVVWKRYCQQAYATDGSVAGDALSCSSFGSSGIRDGRHNAFFDMLLHICRRSPHLKHISLGCLEELTEHRARVLEAILHAQQRGGLCHHHHHRGQLRRPCSCTVVSAPSLLLLPSLVSSGDEPQPPVPCLESLHINTIKGEHSCSTSAISTGGASDDSGSNEEPLPPGGRGDGRDGAGSERRPTAAAVALPCRSGRISDLLLAFPALRRLSIDADDASDELLLGFASANGRAARLDCLTITVHDPPSLPAASGSVALSSIPKPPSNAAWEAVRRACPDLRVTLNVLHSYLGTRALLDGILQPAMPLVHFRSLFCGAINTAAVTFMARHYSSTLESITVVEGLNGHVPLFYEAETEEDPFVMLAWKCNRLCTFALIGVAILADDVVAIARLRGSQLRTFMIPDCCLMFMRDAEEPDYGSRLSPSFVQQVTESVGYAWHPLEYADLHAAVKSECADADTAYLSLLLSDHLPATSASERGGGGSSSSASHKLPSFGVAVPPVGVARRR